MSSSGDVDNAISLELNLKGHKKPITAISFDPSTDRFASSSEDSAIMIWNLSKNDRSYNFMGHSDVVTDIQYSKNGKLIASCSRDQTVRIWVAAIKGDSSNFRAHSSAIQTLTFSPDNEKVCLLNKYTSIQCFFRF